MAKYRKKPVVIEAIQFTDKTKDKAFNFVTCNHYADFDDEKNPIMYIQTLEGEHKAVLGDWIIKGIAGEFYPCKADIFAATYDWVSE